MKKILKSTLFTSLLILGSTSLYASESHSHGGVTHTHEKINEEKAINIATSMKNGLANKGTINESWESINYSKVEEKMFGKDEEYVVSFNNPELKKEQQTLYIFVDLYGDVKAANYSGK